METEADVAYEVRPSPHLNGLGEPMSYGVVELAGDFEHRTKRLVRTFPNVTYGVSASSVYLRAIRLASRLEAGKKEEKEKP